MKNYLIIIFFLLLTPLYAQNKHGAKSVNKNYQFFQEQLANTKKDTSKGIQLATDWLKKAKQEQNKQQQVKAYQSMMHWVRKEYRMIYADSMLQQAKATQKDAVIGAAYLTIGSAHYNNKEMVKALDNYIKANSYIAKTDDQYLIHKTKYTLAQTNYHLEYHHEAIALFTDCIRYFKEENETAYLKAIHGIGRCYSRIGRYDLCSYYNQLGIKSSYEFEDEHMIPYFENSEGVNQYQQKNYKKAIVLLQKSVIEMEQKKDYVNQTLAYFFIGKCYWEQNEKEKAVSYFLVVEGLMEAHDFRHPDLRENFENLITFYKQENNIPKRLLYVDKLIAMNKVLTTEFKYLVYKTHKEFDTQSLLKEKEDIEKSMIYAKKSYRTTIASLIVIIIGLGIIHITNKRKNKKKFNEIMLKKTEKPRPFVYATATNSANISPELTNAILQKLTKFEKSKKYLEKEMSLAKTALLMETNTKYVSMVIAEYRGKKITDYINDLRIDYIVEVLKTQPKYRNYTNQALADEAGFGSTQIFTKSFKNRMELSPSYFIKKLKSTSKTDVKESI